MAARFYWAIIGRWGEIEKSKAVRRSRLCAFRRGHRCRVQLQSKQAAFCFSAFHKAGLEPSPSPYLDATHHRRADLLPIDEGHHSQCGWITVVGARSRHSVVDKR